MKAKTKVYPVQVTFSFTGTFKIKARSQEEANEFAEKHCGLVMGYNIHSSLPADDVDWDFPVHPRKIVGPTLEELI